MSGPAAPGRGYTCAWCGHASDGADLACPACGAAVDLAAVVTESGWSQLPGRRDMAKLQFGRSFCQIEGAYVPVADMGLAAGDSVYFAHHVLLWKETLVQVTVMPMRGGWKRLLAGMPLVMTQAQGPGHIAFSRDAPGELIALPLQPGQAVDVREHLFMVATGQIAYDWFSANVWFTTGSGNDRETHYPLGFTMDRFTAPQQPGLLLLHAAGNVFVRELAPQQSILVRPTALLFKDPRVRMQLHFERPRGGNLGFLSTRSMSVLWLRLWGPGRVAVQSVTERIDAEHQMVSSSSSATQRQW